MAKTNMYYEDNQDLAHDRQLLRVKLLGLPLSFMSDAGVFSKSMIDYGSRVLLENYQPDGAQNLLDVGCGYGVLGITLAKKFHLQTTLTDVNSRALELAQENAKRNDVRMNFLLSNAYEAVDACYDSIISNPPIRAGKKVVHEILTGANAHLNNQGSLTIVIQKKQGAPSAMKKMQDIFGNCEVIARDKGYFILKSIKREV